jgi:hypothetical protein
MNAAKREPLTGQVAAKGPDGKSSAPVGANAPVTRKLGPGAAAEHSSDSVVPFIQKIGAGSIAEIDGVIDELQATRNHLQSESDRAEQEAIRFTQLNETVSGSVKIIADSISEWRRKLGQPVGNQLSG